ncbi:hypothetical protein K449DRAFT_402441 [Hypoxylon sp. EC38]|nr:hypothetical protein K449DRAFT_402441 [Hypoxylon sp. EC38]
MKAENLEYSANVEIISFFKMSVTCSECNERARELVRGSVVPGLVQGVCNYLVHAGGDLEYVIQFRLRSSALETETATTARKVYGAHSIFAYGIAPPRFWHISFYMRSLVTLSVSSTGRRWILHPCAKFHSLEALTRKLHIRDG